MRKKRVAILFMIFTFTFLLIGCEESSIEKVDSKENAATDNKASDKSDKDADDNKTENLSVGESVNFNDVTITLNEVRIESGGEFDEPENDKFIVANLTAENNSDEEIVVSSMVNVELYDDEGYSYTTTILIEGTKGQFDGSIPAGKKLRGEIPFDVSEAESYELHFSDPFKSGKAIWKIGQDDL